MKKFFTLLVCLMTALLFLPGAIAEEEELGTFAYTIEALDETIYIPENMTVTNETDSDTGVALTLALNGRADCGYGIDISYSEAYEGYSMLSMPDDMRQQMIDFYTQNYPGENEPSIMEFDGDYADYADLSPLVASGKGSDGNLYCIYVTVYDGYIFTVSGAIAADEFDYDSYSALYLLYWQTMDLLIG